MHTVTQEDRLSVVKEVIEYHVGDVVTIVFDMRTLDSKVNPFNLFKSNIIPDNREVHKITLEQCTDVEIVDYYLNRELDALAEQMFE
jgi:hypothetical protein